VAINRWRIWITCAIEIASCNQWTCVWMKIGLVLDNNTVITDQSVKRDMHSVFGVCVLFMKIGQIGCSETSVKDYHSQKSADLFFWHVSKHWDTSMAALTCVLHLTNEIEDVIKMNLKKWVTMMGGVWGCPRIAFSGGLWCWRCWTLGGFVWNYKNDNIWG
jgi:hypothetical protein